MTPRLSFARTSSTAALLLAGIAAASSPAAAWQGDGINILVDVSTQKAADAAEEAEKDKKPPPPPPKQSAPGSGQVRPAWHRLDAVSPATVTADARLGSKEQRLSEGRALVAEAEKFSAGYSPGGEGPTKAELEASIGELKSDLDSMSEMGEMESLRLQMAMDRLSKLMSTLSNLLKKASETQNSIVQNIK